MREWLWSVFARFLARPLVWAWLVRRGKRTPYTHIHGEDGSLYMARYWIFNRYDVRPRAWWRDKLPSVRLHYIRRPDADRHMHDHPWDARSIVLKGWYAEVRPHDTESLRQPLSGLASARFFMRKPGTTATIGFGEFHRITQVPPDGVWTLFITWKYRGTWGFLVDGQKVPYKEYLGDRAL